ncbi:MAG: peptidase domain-containing ABC transporter [Blastocatellia bacterium]|nr:peptidase domain-containing ABC transporter [Blastocatellia bacterium]
MRPKFVCVQGHDSNDCGPAALATVARHYGLHVSVVRARDVLDTDQQGTSLTSLCLGAEKLGFKASAGQAKIGVLDRIPLPAIAHFNDTTEGHFVVLHQVTASSIVIADPAQGVVALSREEFERRWSKALLLLAPGDDFKPNEELPSSFQALVKLAFRERKLLMQSVVCAGLISLLGLAQSFFVQMVLDRVIPFSNRSLLTILVIGVFVILGFRSLYGFLRQYLLAYLGMKYELSLGLGYMDRVLRLPVKFFEQRTTGDIYSRVTDVTSVQMAITNGLLSACIDLVMLVGLAGLMAWYNLKLTLLTLAFVPVLAAVTLGLQRPVVRKQREVREAFSGVSSKFIEAVGTIRILKVFTAEPAAFDRIREQYLKLENAQFRRNLLMGALAATSTMLTGVISIALLWVGAYLVMDAEMTVGKMMFFSSLLGMFLAPIDHLAPSMTMIQEALIGLERLGDAHQLPAEDEENGRTLEQFDLRGEIVFDRVSFWYREGYPVVNDISFTVPAGKTVAVLGETGSGKTSLANLVARLYEIQEGRILLDGMDLRDINRAALRSQIGVIFQDPSLTGGTIFDNIALGKPNATLEEVQAAARLAEAHDFIMALPKRYDYDVGDRGVALSSGQRQRIAIARALIRNAAILILDEATSNLDSQTERRVMDNIRTHCPGKTVFLITHRLTTVMHTDSIVVLDKGRIVEQGSHAELLDKQGKYHQFWSAMLPEYFDDLENQSSGFRV